MSGEEMPFVQCLFLWEDSLFLPLTLKVDMGYGGEKGELAMNMRTTLVRVYDDKIVVEQPKVYLLSYDVKDSDTCSGIYKELNHFLETISGYKDDNENEKDDEKSEEKDAIKILRTGWYVWYSASAEGLKRKIVNKVQQICPNHDFKCHVVEAIKGLESLQLDEQTKNKVTKWLKLHPMRTILDVYLQNHNRDTPLSRPEVSSQRLQNPLPNEQG